VGEDQPAARAAKGLVGGGGDKVGVRERIGMDACRHHAGDVRHVDGQVGADGFGDLPEPREVDDARIGAGAGNDHSGSVLAGQISYLLVIDGLGVALHPVGDHLEELAGKACRTPVSQMTAMTEIHSQDRVAGLEHGKVHGHIGLGTGMRLHVGIFRVEEPTGPFLSQPFGNVHKFAATIVSSAWVTLGIFIGQDRTLRLKHRPADEMLGSNELELSLLTFLLVTDYPGNFRINNFELRHPFPFTDNRQAFCPSTGCDDGRQGEDPAGARRSFTGLGGRPLLGQTLNQFQPPLMASPLEGFVQPYRYDFQS